MDEKAIEEGNFSEGASKKYLAWSAHLSRLLRALGLDGKAQKPVTIQDYIAAKRVAA